SRVAKAGYIETPSPFAECCRGVDAESPVWRGYVHHHSIVWHDKGVLMLMPKLPVIEHVAFLEEEISMVLGMGASHWNSYFFWEGVIQWQVVQEFGLFRPF